jgi:hypothetical protein
MGADTAAGRGRSKNSARLLAAGRGGASAFLTFNNRRAGAFKRRVKFRQR